MKKYNVPEVTLVILHAESGILAQSPIGVEATKVKVDGFGAEIGGDVSFGNENLFE